MRLRSVCLLAVCFPVALAAQQAASWLDRPPANWNEPGTAIPAAPVPAQDNIGPSKCGNEVRPPTDQIERELVHHGWKLYSKAQRYGSVTVLFALTDTDGMCRPRGYQVFVFDKDRFAGTLSPMPMNSREDGALSVVRNSRGHHLSVQFLRYTPDDPLCCPSRVSTVEFNVNSTGPTVTPTNISTQKTSSGANTAPR